LRKPAKEKLKSRNPKFETNLNDQKAESRNELISELRVLDFGFEFICFGFGASGFGFKKDAA